MTTYSEKLKDPRWQRKRLEILGRDNFTCRQCSSEAKTLHVHHLSYFDGRDPWDVPDSSLITLCHDCHEEDHLLQRRVFAAFVDAFRVFGARLDDLILIGAAIYAALNGSKIQLSTDDWKGLAKLIEAALRARASGKNLEDISINVPGDQEKP